MNPNDNQQIGNIIKLNDGYVLNLYGQTIACRDEKELGVRVARLAKRGRKAGLEPKSAPAAAAVPAAEVLPRMAEDQREGIQLGNLYKMIQARLAGEMTEEELMDATILACPDLDRERVVATIQQYTERFFGMAPPDPGQESPLGPKCACEQCQMNQSVPNHLGMCVACFKGEHPHPPAGYVEPAPGPKVVNMPQSWWSGEEDDEDESDASPVPGELAGGQSDLAEEGADVPGVPAEVSGPGDGAA